MAKGRPIKHGLIKHRLYFKWNHMKQRCENPNYIGYANYGGNGVRVCDAWNDFKPFYDWAINNGWKDGLQLDKDVRGDGKLYSPETCCFITKKENLNRKKSNVMYNGKRYSMKQLTDEYNMPYQSVILRLRLGWTLEEAISTPIRKYKQAS